MNEVPKGLRLQIGIFGRTNVGKSSFLNMICGQKTAITSCHPGTTTDVVEKTMELLPVGPVVLLDTAGVDDDSTLSADRMEKTMKIFHRADVAVIVIESGIFGEFEEKIIAECRKNTIPVIAVLNKIDVRPPEPSFIEKIKSAIGQVISCSCLDMKNREHYITDFKTALMQILPEGHLSSPSLISDLVPSGGMVILIVPIDLEAPKGRLILPQVQTIRDALDNDASVIIVKEREYSHILENLKRVPDLVVCDSQAVQKMIADTPVSVKCTTFSILFARFKGDLNTLTKGLTVIDRLKPGDKVLIAEACSHHALQDDIGRVKIPRWLRQYTGMDLTVDISSGRDYPSDMTGYKLIIHCGACMLTSREMHLRIRRAELDGIGVTNYGLCISFLHGVLKRVLSPFPAAWDVFERLSLSGKNEGVHPSAQS
ncbi:MAG: [FeFe] hydrogenase H-cluster maturation GTPase HydF [Candidatus Aureabacteria bacterium]|nr:[FeFe] hydrogenase H-cluster maturation GTPase HydF [Candidatus Auribacterota bacterium]